MADINIVNQGAQFGAESVFGTSVACDKSLSTLGLSRAMPLGAGTLFRAQGNKLATTSVPVGRRRTEFNLAGVMDYGELIYPLCSGIKLVTPTSDGTNGKKWTFAYSKAAADAKQSFTIEMGDATHAQKATGCVLTDLTLDMSWETTQVTGKFIGQQLQDDITLTATPTVLATNLLNPGTFAVKTGATAAAAAAAGEFGRPFNVQLNIPGISQPLNRMSSTDVSHIAMMENALDGMTLKVTTGADDADLAFLTNWTAGSTVFWQITNTGAVIAGAIPSAYAFSLICATRVINPYTPSENQGAATAEWTLPLVFDATSGFAFQLFVVNTFATL